MLAIPMSRLTPAHPRREALQDAPAEMKSKANHRARGDNENKHWHSFSIATIHDDQQYRCDFIRQFLLEPKQLGEGGNCEREGNSP